MTGTAAAPAAAPSAAPADGGAPAEGTKRNGAADATQAGGKSPPNVSTAPDAPANTMATSMADAPAKPPGQAALNPPAPGSKNRAPDFVDPRFWDGERGVVKLRELGEAHREAVRKLSMRSDDLMKSIDADKRARVPKTPAEYAFKVSDTYIAKAAEKGVKIDPETAIDQRDPVVRAMAASAHKHGLDQEVFSDMLANYHFARMSSRPDPRMTVMKLGENANERIAHVRMFLDGAIGEDDRNHLVQHVGGITPRFIEIMERIMRAGGARTALPGQSGGAAAGGVPMSKDELRKLMMSDEYNDPRNPGYREIQKKVQDGFARLGQGQQVPTARLNGGFRRSA